MEHKQAHNVKNQDQTKDKTLRVTAVWSWLFNAEAKLNPISDKDIKQKFNFATKSREKPLQN